MPDSAGIFPNGLVEISRTRSITGTSTSVCQYNFGLYYVLTKAPGDSADENAESIMDFQHWVQMQSCTGAAPTFGDEPWSETISAQNGTLYAADEEGTAIYAVQLSATFAKNY